MRTIHTINKWSLIINIFLFIIPILGMLVMILLGLIQIILAIVISTLYYTTLKKQERFLLYSYWLFVFLNIVPMIIIQFYDYTIFDFPGSIPYFIIPGCIAFYFVYVTYRLNKALLNYETYKLLTNTTIPSQNIGMLSTQNKV